MKKDSLFLMISCLFLVSCMKKYKYTLKLKHCNDNLYVESFNINPAGVDADYITDSLNFRFYVGRWDSDHENFSYTCMGDSIFIKKLDTTGDFQVLEQRAYSLKKLKQQKTFH
jgi:hypothetical protein